MLDGALLLVLQCWSTSTSRTGGLFLKSSLLHNPPCSWPYISRVGSN